MNEATDVPDREAQQPEDEQNDEESPEHRSTNRFEVYQLPEPTTVVGDVGILSDDATPKDG